jgi:CysZ protein
MDKITTVNQNEKNLMNGLYYLIHGFKLIAKPGLKRYVIMPFALNVLVFIGIFMLAKHYFSALNQTIMPHLPAWLQWIDGILWLVFFVSFFMVILYTFVTLANIIAAPFNSLLAEKIEFYLTGKALDNQTMLSTLKDIPRMIKRQLAILAYYLPRALLLLVLFFIPIIQLAVPLLWFVFNAWLMTLQYIDYPTDNHRIPLTYVMGQLRKKRLLTLSFGIGTLALTMIPLLNCIVMPAAVAGATELWLTELASSNDHL